MVFMQGIGVAELGLLLFIIMIPTILWFWALIDVMQSNFSDSNNKLMWVMIILLVPVIGSILYLIIGRNQKIKV
jgi:hypothetical protein